MADTEMLIETDRCDEEVATASPEAAPEIVQPKSVTDQLDKLIELQEQTDQEIERLNTPSGVLDTVAPFRTSTS